MRQIAALVLLLAAPPALADDTPSAPQDGARIKVLGAYFGYNVDAKKFVDATHNVAANCDGLAKCYYKADSDVLGDPTPGIGKDMRIAYQCGDKVWVAYTQPDAPSQRAVLLTCAQPTPPMSR